MNGDYEEEDDDIEDEITSESDTDSEGKGEKLLMMNVCCDFLHPSQQIFSHIMTVLPGLDQCKAADKVYCSRTQHSDSVGDEVPIKDWDEKVLD